MKKSKVLRLLRKMNKRLKSLEARLDDEGNPDCIGFNTPPEPEDFEDDSADVATETTLKIGFRHKP